MRKLKPISNSEINDFFAIESENSEKKYYDYFASAIDGLKDSAIGPYFWYIVNYSKMKIELVSSNIDQFTPFTKEDWLNSTDVFGEIFHPDDRYHVFSAVQFTATMNKDIHAHKVNKVRINIYGRILNKNKEYYWILTNSPKQYINENNQMESCLVVFYDLSHFKITEAPLLSIIDSSNEEVQYFKHINREIKKIDVHIPHITQREKEVLHLMAQGLTTSEIAITLFISTHTVENHKRNLRGKTNTNSAPELIAYCMNHSILMM